MSDNNFKLNDLSNFSNVLNKGIYPQEIEDALNGGTKLVKVQLEKGETIDIDNVELEFKGDHYQVTQKGIEELEKDIEKADSLPVGTTVPDEKVYHELQSKINIEKADENPCWDGYVQYGTKMKDGEKVPNCIPKKDADKKKAEDESVEKGKALPVGAERNYNGVIHVKKNDGKWVPKKKDGDKSNKKKDKKEQKGDKGYSLEYKGIKIKDEKDGTPNYKAQNMLKDGTENTVSGVKKVLQDKPSRNFSIQEMDAIRSKNARDGLGLPDYDRKREHKTGMELTQESKKAIKEKFKLAEENSKKENKKEEGNNRPHISKKELKNLDIGDKINWYSPDGVKSATIKEKDGIYVKMKEGGEIPYESIKSAEKKT